MEDTVLTDDSLDNFDDQFGERPRERWAPVGAVASPPPSITSEDSHVQMADQLKHLEEEQEQLNSSLLGLTTHFAQVQFRLKQIVNAPIEDKENLLKDLEEFAFKGCPDVRGCKSQDAQMLEDASEKEHESKITQQREKQMELISQLKNQLDDLEQFAYEDGNIELPQKKVMEKQSAIIDELREKLDMKLDDFDKLTTEELRTMVDSAIGRIVNPIKVKEQVIGQLKNQIGDLERFIEFLQDEATAEELQEMKLLKDDDNDSTTGQCCASPTSRRAKAEKTLKNAEDVKRVREEKLTSMKKALALLQYIAINQLGCGVERTQNKQPKGEPGLDYYDMLRKLDRAISHVAELAKRKEEEPPPDSDYTSDSSDSPVCRPLDEVTIAVRRELAPIIRDLFEHGMVRLTTSRALMTPLTACLSPPRPGKESKMHAWDLFLKYFEIKHGKQYAKSTARKLSQSFDLEIVGGTAITAKQTLLAAIDYVHGSHDPLKRSKDAQFKAFVCQALNEHRLAQWCRLICRTSYLIETYYQPWSYMIKTGFDGTLQLLDKLSDVNFTLPVDIAILQFYNIKDAF
ncbi:RUN domain-containing protein 1-like isoform X2 [Amphiura filiformis]|uniref:RUN domain-containing protein 1-like isoform X2 n=1 Tax=Amphiura filiformis TaxID=82378 RepID=UPI003B21759C